MAVPDTVDWPGAVRLASSLSYTVTAILPRRRPEEAWVVEVQRSRRVMPCRGEHRDATCALLVAVRDALLLDAPIVRIEWIVPPIQAEGLRLQAEAEQRWRDERLRVALEAWT